MRASNNRNFLDSAMTSRHTKRRRRKRFRVAALVLCALLCVGVALGGVNYFMVHSSAPRIIRPEDAAAWKDFDCILVLGAQVQPDGTPSHVLEDRMIRAVELYGVEAAPVILVSGDHGQINYDEVSAMKQYAVDHGVPSQDVFMDHAGFSTYETMYRARDIFQAKRVLIVTQGYHMTRALYIARQLGLDAWGVTCDYRSYATQNYMSAREVAARVKDFIKCIFKPKSKYLGQPHDLSAEGANGDETNGEIEVNGEWVPLVFPPRPSATQ
ncbi:MAG: YdcF family protein [Oscillospiraceae bacterium]|jgi:vancomycin permeability regulator SanA|nr:YdcF family protein [Oscillospiraceae bacterium]